MCRTAAALAAALAALGAWRWLLEGEADEVVLICEANSMYKECIKTYHLATEERWRGYVDSCRQAFHTLDEPAQKLLRHALRAGKILDPTVLERGVRWAHPVHGAGDTCRGSSRYKRDDELRAEHSAPDRDAYLQAKMRPLRERRVDFSEVPSALRHGETVTFDASRLVPSSWFNITFSELSDLHPETNGDIPVWMGDGMRRTKGGRQCSDMLHDFQDEFRAHGHRTFRARVIRMLVIPYLLRYVCPMEVGPLSLKTMARMSRRFHRDDVPHSNFFNNTPAALKVQSKINKRKHENLFIGVTNINMNRLENFSKDFGEMIFPGEVEATHSLLWAGQQRGGMHADFQDNIIIQLTGKADVIVFPANCSASSQFLPNQVTVKDWVKKGMKPGQIRAPWFHVILKEGEGIAVPSHAWHKVVSTQSRRLAVNAFMEPKFGHMRWKSAPNNYFVQEDRANSAMRVLWLRSMRHLWETRRLHYMMHTDRNDFVR